VKLPRPLVGSSSTHASMSEYCRSLDSTTKHRYLDKLQLLGLDESGDPYTAHNAEKFVENMSLWPPVEYSHIFCLLHW